MIEFEPEHKIETQRLLMRRFHKSDAAEVFANWMSDPSVSSTVNWEPHQSVLQTKKVLKVWGELDREGRSSNWAIIEKSTGRIIGSIDFHDIYLMTGSADIGYSIMRSCWGKGYATEALSAMLKYGFEVLSYHRISAEYLWENPASGRVMQKAGMHFLSDKKIIHKGRVKDSGVYSLTREEYQLEHADI